MCSTLKCISWTREIAQQIKALAAQAWWPELNLQNPHKDKGANSPKLSSSFHICNMACTTKYSHIHTNNIFNVFLMRKWLWIRTEQINQLLWMRLLKKDIKSKVWGAEEVLNEQMKSEWSSRWTSIVDMRMAKSRCLRHMGNWQRHPTHTHPRSGSVQVQTLAVNANASNHRLLLPDVYILRLLTYGYQLTHHTTPPQCCAQLMLRFQDAAKLEKLHKGIHGYLTPAFLSVCLSFPHYFTVPTQISRPQQHRI